MNTAIAAIISPHWVLTMRSTQRSWTMNFLLLMALVGTSIILHACNQERADGSTQVLSNVQMAPTHPNAANFSFTGYSHPSQLGVYTWTTNSRSPHHTGGQHAKWVVPVSDRKGQIGAPVSMWVTPSFHVKAGNNPEEWLERLQAEFDGQPQVKLPMRVRAGEGRGSGWEHAVSAAEVEYGIKSHPLAPIVAWP